MESQVGRFKQDALRQDIYLSAAFVAEMVAFLINIFHIGTRSHHAGLVVAVYESEGMSKFMDHLLSESVYQQFFVLFHAITLIS